MKPASKSIVLGHVTIKTETKVWPVAVFGQRDGARHHANYATMAARAGDLDTLEKLDASPALDDKGIPVKTAWYTVSTVPYEPELVLGAEGDQG